MDSWILASLSVQWQKGVGLASRAAERARTFRTTFGELHLYLQTVLITILGPLGAYKWDISTVVLG